MYSTTLIFPMLALVNLFFPLDSDQVKMAPKDNCVCEHRFVQKQQHMVEKSMDKLGLEMFKKF